MSQLIDQAARTTALTDLSRSFLVEAGAGSGKTSLMAGRIAVMLAEGDDPAGIAAVSFTEMAASELMGRVVSFVERLAAGTVPPDLRAAFPEGLDARRRANVAAARDRLGEVTCTTIHGFCQRLLKPYPVEANIDPGARILDPAEANLIFDDVFGDWLRGRLSGTDADLDTVTAFVANDPERAVRTIREIADTIRFNRNVDVAPHAMSDDPCAAFREAVAAFSAFHAGVGYPQEENAAIVSAFADLAGGMAPATAQPHVAAVAALSVVPSPVLLKSDGEFKLYRVKTKWQRSAPNKKLGDRHNDEAAVHYDACRDAFVSLRLGAAAHALASLVAEIRPLIDVFREHKRRAALLDFEDLMISTRKMLRHHAAVRAALSRRYPRILVDEFQDTDPVQTEIFRLLAFDPPSDAGGAWRPRPGSVFLVGDPKQAIYRFRGADVRAYVETRDAMRAVDAGSILEVGTNFRSCRSILEWVNGRFEVPLSAADQPGFGRLMHHREDHAEGPCVVAMDVDVAGDADGARDMEAAAVADLCSRLVGSLTVHDKATGNLRKCEPGDIALLAPVGTDLWRYEGALEAVGLAVSTQAGKGMFRRQEVQDLIAVTRILADPRDRLALGAFLRGPLVGLTEEALLDVSNGIEPPEDGTLPFLRVGMREEDVSHPLARDVMGKLARLQAHARTTTPYDALCRAVEVLDVRPLLLARHGGRAERALANVDRFLELSRPYSVRGLRAFSDAMRRAWEDGERLGEGRPDAEEQSVSLITMHSAKGLEWPVVIPVNTLTEVFRIPSIVTDAGTGAMSMPFMGVEPAGHAEARDRYAAAQSAERVRLWYVATTRARDLLILPRHSADKPKSWAAVVDLDVVSLPSLDVSALPAWNGDVRGGGANRQTEGAFLSQADAIEAARRPVVWDTPSRSEGARLSSAPLSLDDLVEAEPETDGFLMINGSKERGTVFHKLMEEVLNGETGDGEPGLRARAAELVAQLGGATGLPTRELDPAELARTVARALAVPQVAELRHRLVPELPLGHVDERDEAEVAVYGVTDAVAVTPEGTVDVVVDWKSDVRPDRRMVAKYAEQVRRYLSTLDAERGLLVFATTGEVVEVRET